MADPLPDSYLIEPLEQSDRVTGEDVLELWAREDAVPGLVARQRLAQVCMVGSDDSGLAGLSTIEAGRVDRLGANLFTARIFVGSDHRETALGSHLTIEMFEYLQRRYSSGEDRSVLGMYGEVESEIVKRFRNQAVWTEIGMFFIGEGPRGEHLRVAWFDGAPAPEHASMAGAQS